MPYSAKQVAELQTLRDDPTYDGMDDAAFHTAVNDPTVEVLRKDITTLEVFNTFIGADMPLRSSDEWQDLMLLMTANAAGTFSLQNGSNIYLVLQNAFVGKTNTLNALAAIQNKMISPAEAAGLPAPNLGDVARTT
jgi:hypothetical protein